MLKQIKLFALMVLAVGFLASCANDGEVREAAANSVSDDNTAVTPNQNVTTNADGSVTFSNDANKAPEAAPAPTGPTTTIQFTETEFDFGKIDQGETVQHTYEFKNTGTEPLIISSAKGSCGCTVPKWPKEPIAPGATASIDVEFNSKGKKSKQNKKVTITANTNPPQSFIYLKGEVIAPEGEATPKVQVQ